MVVDMRNQRGAAQQMPLMTFSAPDDTVNIALRHGICMVQESFQGCGGHLYRRMQKFAPCNPCRELDL